jgi:hypothetical protein
MTKAPVHKVTKGMTFNASHADAMPLYRVVGFRGNGVWDCIVDEMDPDYAGTARVFDELEILQRVASREGVIRTINGSDEWWQSQKVDAVIHYKDGFDKFVRCRIVQAEGAKKALPFALVGNWRENDLPNVAAWGEIRESYHVKQIRQQNIFQPHFSHIYEAQDNFPRGAVDPRTLPELDLAIPKLTPEQERAKYLNDLRQELVGLLGTCPRGDEDFTKNITEMLIKAQAKLNTASI